MSRPPHVLLVAPTARVAAAVTDGLVDLGARVTLVSSFQAARRGLESAPDLLISEIRLGEYNGLHLALRAQGRGIRSIVLGDLDPVTKKDAESLGADYLSDSCDPARLTDALRAAVLPSRGRFERRTHAA